MSLHRRAYDCKDIDEWWAKAERVECPVEVRDQFWRTAQAAKEAGMPKEKAFPLSGEVFKDLSRDCLPGDLVWWRSLGGEICEGELSEWDNGTAIVKTNKGQVAVRCD